jgi:hypothetical protein
MKIKSLTFLALVLAPAALFAQATTTMVGGDRDAHGCIPSAGYTWSESAQKCVRSWEQKNNINVTCVQTALDKRENSIMTAHDAFNTAIKNALSTRLTSLKASYTEPTQTLRKTKRQQATTAFKTATQAAHTNMRTARVSAWNTFNTDMKACGVKHDEKPHTVAVPAVTL